MRLPGSAYRSPVRYLLTLWLCAACGGGAGMPPDKGGIYAMDFFTHNQQAANYAIFHSPAHSSRVVLVWLQCHLGSKPINLPEVEENEGVDWLGNEVLLGEKFWGLDNVQPTGSPSNTNWAVLSNKRPRQTFQPGRGGNLFYTRKIFKRVTPTWIDSINTLAVTYGQEDQSSNLEYRNMAAVMTIDQDQHNDSNSFIGAHEIGHQLGVKHRDFDPGFVMCSSVNCPIGRKVSGAYASFGDTTPRPTGSDCYEARRGGVEAKIFW